ncbi:hypothetical protein AUK40_02885 [Candidatus Wirthbacteria bacterium CG2_30_54_11]|uniref:Uncharacterized protein n=1 Tax=Candidatus Wirthbacteria bacterium CG2_30_54_11 TaxID=1817892 RepID=A0A1J5IWK9_9BACT|nr:MAG: hypothetical protein AUK40_02885 [Candidatus Wirthbacteria bacterium CG2_30_54_11]
MKKKIVKIIAAFLGLVVLGIVLVLGYLGYIPGLSALLGANKPRDLGVTWTQEDLASVHQKSGVDYQFGALPSDTPPEQSVIYKGTREVKQEFTSSEITASLNNKNSKYYPFQDVQVRFNADGSGEISGKIDKAKLKGFATVIDFPSAVSSRAIDLLPPDPVFYVKMKASLKDNQVAIFEPQAFQIGRMSMPVSMFLSLVPEGIFQAAYADSIADELGKYDNKREWIISYINRRLGSITGFHADEAYFTDGQLYYDGTLSREVLTSQ